MPPALHKDKGVDRHRPVRQDCSPFDFLAQCKASSAPEVEVGKFWNALKGLGIKEAWVIASIKETYPIENGVSVANLFDFLAKWKVQSKGRINRFRIMDRECLVGVWLR